MTSVRGFVARTSLNLVQGGESLLPLCGSWTNRFWKKVQKHEEGCWIWIGSKDNNGYGRLNLKIDGKWSPVLAHRLSMELHIKRKLKPGECVLHNCPGGDNSSCVNPDHLWIGTVAENNKDMMKKGRFKHHGMKGSQIWNSKLTEDQVREIRKRCVVKRGKGDNRFNLAKEFGVHHSVIGDIVNQKTWRHVK